MSDLPLEVDCRTTKQLLDAGGDFLLLDCREADEYALVNIPGAQLIPMSELQARIGELQSATDHRVVVHCHHGGRSLRVARWLRDQGFAKAQSMAGGIDQWSTDIDPTLQRY